MTAERSCTAYLLLEVMAKYSPFKSAWNIDLQNVYTVHVSETFPGINKYDDVKVSIELKNETPINNERN